MSEANSSAYVVACCSGRDTFYDSHKSSRTISHMLATTTSVFNSARKLFLYLTTYAVAKQLLSIFTDFYR